MIWFTLILNKEYDGDGYEEMGDYGSYEEAVSYKDYYKERYGLKEEDFDIEEYDDEDCV